MKRTEGGNSHDHRLVIRLSFSLSLFALFSLEFGLKDELPTRGLMMIYLLDLQQSPHSSLTPSESDAEEEERKREKSWVSLMLEFEYEFFNMNEGREEKCRLSESSQRWLHQ